MRLPSHRLDGQRRSVRICVLLALGLTLLAVSEFFETAPRVFKGRSAAVSEFLFNQFGATGLAARWLAPALLLLLFARSVWRRANRIPSDRWYRR